MRSIIFSVLGVLVQLSTSSVALAATATIDGQAGGPTPFIRQVNATVSPAQSLAAVQFTITPKPGSVTRPVSARYTSDYLQNRGYFNPQTGALTVPVFGLYPGFTNDVSLKFAFTDSTTQQDSVTITTPSWAGNCAEIDTAMVIQARTNSQALSYDYMLLKFMCGADSPVIMDTDGAVRWVSPAGVPNLASIFFDNAIYISSPPPGSGQSTGITRIELDGTFRFLRDYSSLGVTSTGHHNFDPGRDGILMDVDTTTQTESVIIEVDAEGNPLHTWNFGDIIASAIRAGGDDPTGFVRPAVEGISCGNPAGCADDWFHNNAAAYRAKDDSLIVSSRENFVIDVDYDTSAIKWILGDLTKRWAEFPELRQFALRLGRNTQPPIGQHGISVTHKGRLLLFDDGQNSLHQSPAGIERNISAERKYRIRKKRGVATEVWSHTDNGYFSPFCSSIYEDAPKDFLINYSIIQNLAGGPFAELIGLDARQNKVFDYRYHTPGCTPWNSVPIHLESLVFSDGQSG